MARQIRNTRHNTSKTKTEYKEEAYSTPGMKEYIASIALAKRRLDMGHRSSVYEEYFTEDRIIVRFDRKTHRRLTNYYRKVYSGIKRSIIPISCIFKFAGVRKVEITGIEVDNLGTYLLIPTDSITAVWDIDKKKYTTLPNFYNGMRFKPDDEMCKNYPTLFRPNEVHKITNDILTIYYSFKDKKDLEKFAKHLVFQQSKCIYRKKNEEQKHTNH